MAKVSLRIYNQEIGTLIDQGQIEEAVGHCQHILKTYPKHLETYRMLGKAYLEAKRYQDATDIFSRLLVSVPDDFIAHAGMSLIADETEKLDDAIWHMERAFESQPSNAAVQSELQRLYGRRDGVQPPKVRMTNGALAHVYVQGELYTQAIAEIMNVEAQDPGRLDMQTLLAKAYFYSGQRVEASKIAADLLAKSPYCLDANRILAEILPETSRAENAEIYSERVNALDPYTAFTKGSIFNTDEVPDAAVSLERLEWHPGSAPDWDASAGEANATEEQPVWLKEAEDAPGFEPASAIDTSTEEEDIPDFMRAAGWGPSSGAEEEPQSFFDDNEETTDSDEPIEQAELPDWMKDIAPPQEELAATEEAEMGDDMADDWINDLLGESGDETEKPEGEKADDFDLGDLGTSNEEQDAALNWLENLAANQGANPEELITDPNARTEDAPDWVKKAQDVSAGTAAAAAGLAASASMDEGASDEEDADDMAWLGELNDEAEPATPVQAAEESDAEDLDWLSELGSEETASPQPTQAEEEDANDMAWLDGLDNEEAAPPPPAQTEEKDGDDMAWLNVLDDEETSSPSLPTQTEEDDDMPKWLQDDGQQAQPETQPMQPGETPAAGVSDPTIGELGTSSEEQDAALNWLENLAANQGAKPEELITDPNARTEDAPDWVKKAQDMNTETPVTEPALAAPAEEDDNLAWLNDFNTDDEEEAALAEHAKARLNLEDEDPLPSTIPSKEEEPSMPEMPDLAALTAKEEMPSAEAPIPTAEEEAIPETPDFAALVAEEEMSAQASDMPEPPAEETPEIASELTGQEEEDPSWLQDLQESTVPQETEPAATEEELPSWLSDLGETTSAQESTGAPEAQDDDLPEWLKVEEDAPPQPEEILQPTQADEWKPVEPPAVEEKPVPKQEPPTPVQTEEKTTPPAPEEKSAPPAKEEAEEQPTRRASRSTDTTMPRDVTLMSAQAALNEGNVSAAVAEYTKLIKKKRLLDETIYALREALYDYPVNIAIWQTLGDAYMRAGRLQEAIDAYTKAEELLR